MTRGGKRNGAGRPKNYMTWEELNWIDDRMTRLLCSREALRERKIRQLRSRGATALDTYLEFEELYRQAIWIKPENAIGTPLEDFELMQNIEYLRNIIPVPSRLEKAKALRQVIAAAEAHFGRRISYRLVASLLIPAKTKFPEGARPLPWYSCIV